MNTLKIRLYFYYKGELKEKWFKLTPPKNITNNYEQQQAFLFEWGNKTLRKWFKEETGEEYNKEVYVREFINE